LKKPNVVIFNPDSYRGDVLGHLGNPAAVTPCVDQLVDEGGVSYANAFSQSPVCTPSRCSFMTGWYPHVHGHRSMRNMLKQHEPSLFSVLRREGYFTWWGGKNDLFSVTVGEDYLKYCDHKFKPGGVDTGLFHPSPRPEGDALHRVFFRGEISSDEGGGVYTNRDAECIQGAVDFINNSQDDMPFFIFLPLGNPHPAYIVEESLRSRIPTDELPPRVSSTSLQGKHPAVLDAMREAYKSSRVAEEEWRELKAVYYGMCTKVDALFGQVVEALKAKSLYDDTLIVFMSDHGDFAGDYDLPEKTHSTLQDALVRVPFVVKPPRDVAIQSGVRTHLVELVDMTATIYDLLGIEPEYACQGLSLRDSLAGSDKEIRDAVFAEVGSRAGEEGFINTDVFRMPSDSFYAIQSGAAIPFHEAGSYAVMCRTHEYKYVRRSYNDCHELYDLRKDPNETHNLSGSPPCAAVEQQMQLRMLDYFMQTGDVLPHEVDSRGV